MNVVPPACLIQDFFRVTSIKTKFVGPLLEQRLKKYGMYNMELAAFVFLCDPRSLVLILLEYSYASGISYHPKSRQLHGLPIKMEMLKDERSLRTIMALYSIEERLVISSIGCENWRSTAENKKLLWPIVERINKVLCDANNKFNKLMVES